MAGKKKELTVGILLSDDELFRETLSSESSLDVFIEPRDVQQMLGYLRKMAAQGKTIKRLILFGHGGKKNVHRVGLLKPEDVDARKIRQQRERYYRAMLRENREIEKLDRKLQVTKDPKIRAQLKEDIEDKRDFEKQAQALYQDGSFKEQAFRDIEDLFESNAQIGLINCWPAADPRGKRFMKHIGQSFLHRNGGHVVGNEDVVDVRKYSVFKAWLNGKDQHLIEGRGKWHVEQTPAAGATQAICGAACKDFEEYGFCDRVVGADGGYCYSHR